ncbi:hypothetical protein DLJ53_25770 [Acuticoccus sediminis]|uniref:Uncharacterized protein n=1 Tax=Acuticoccus sediminis TaxID=2184697 RepID=A0A8B2NMK3_9HYPH|nr:hypothetical protein [Acuticoccus sediminis]RAH99034.1 hypothetical protein DLJ53_25770 [Acuticoccus sediminis]
MQVDYEAEAQAGYRLMAEWAEEIECMAFAPAFGADYHDEFGDDDEFTEEEEAILDALLCGDDEWGGETSKFTDVEFEAMARVGRRLMGDWNCGVVPTKQLNDDISVVLPPVRSEVCENAWNDECVAFNATYHGVGVNDAGDYVYPRHPEIGRLLNVHSYAPLTDEGCHRAFAGASFR